MPPTWTRPPKVQQLITWRVCYTPAKVLVLSLRHGRKTWCYQLLPSTRYQRLMQPGDQ